LKENTKGGYKMKLKRDKIKEFDIPEEFMKGFLDHLEEELKEVDASDKAEEDIYVLINNVIKYKAEEESQVYEEAYAMGHPEYGFRTLTGIIRRALTDFDHLFEFWVKHDELYERIVGKKRKED